MALFGFRMTIDGISGELDFSTNAAQTYAMALDLLNGGWSVKLDIWLKSTKPGRNRLVRTYSRLHVNYDNNLIYTEDHILLFGRDEYSTYLNPLLVAEAVQTTL